MPARTAGSGITISMMKEKEKVIRYRVCWCVRVDSIRVRADSVCVRVDSIRVRADSVCVRVVIFAFVLSYS